MNTILLVEDDMWVVESLRQTLNCEKYHIVHVPTLHLGYQFFENQRPNGVILDRHLPDGDGLELVHYLHEVIPSLPILILSEKSGVSERVVGLEKGADEYLEKPFSAAELRLRLDKLLNSTKQIQNERYYAGSITVFPSQGITRVRDREVPLRKREFQILAFLIKHKNQLVSREMVVNHIWGDADTPSDTTVDVYVRRIRQVLGNTEKIIKTIRGYGYIVKE
jgi:DNA-binding response OmpR family regulator